MRLPSYGERSVTTAAILEKSRCQEGQEVVSGQDMLDRDTAQPRNLFYIFTTLHVMQTRYCDEISVCPSVCPSVCLSVCKTRDL